MRILGDENVAKTLAGGNNWCLSCIEAPGTASTAS